MEDHTLDAAFVAPRRYDDTHTAYLTAKSPPEGKHRESWYLYDLEFDGQIVVTNSKDAECDLARVLLARGFKGVVTVLDAITGKPRTIVNIEKAAKLRTVEEDRDGLRFRKYVEHPAEPPPAGETAKVGIPAREVANAMPPADTGGAA